MQRCGSRLGVQVWLGEVARSNIITIPFIVQSSLGCGWKDNYVFSFFKSPNITEMYNYKLASKSNFVTQITNSPTSVSCEALTGRGK